MKFTANVIFGDNVNPTREVESLRNSGFEVFYDPDLFLGAVVQGEAEDEEQIQPSFTHLVDEVAEHEPPTVEAVGEAASGLAPRSGLEVFLSNLTDAMHPDNIIDDFGEAG